MINKISTKLLFNLILMKFIIAILLIGFVFNSDCDKGDTCDYGQTCCQISSEEYGCCRFENATCCSDRQHCCPANTKCDVSAGTCVQKEGGNLFLEYAQRMEKLEESTIVEVNDILTCISDINALIPQLQELIADVKGGKISAALKIIPSIVTLGQKVVADCASTSFVELVQTLEDVPECIADITAIVPEVEKLIKEVQQKDISGLISTIEVLIPEITKLVSDCAK